ncbi:MAG: hypothetical protein ABSC23_14920 [Bryobacteraceae bacterium]
MSITLMRFFLAIPFVLVGALNAQSGSVENFGKFLPADAKIIETANLTANSGKSRAFVLWMQQPKKVARDPDAGYCGDAVYGDHWFGPTRLSLVDPADGRVLNAIRIVGPAFIGDPADSFRVPYLVSNGYYYVPHLNSKGEGKPEVLRLRDLTGDGVADEFVMFMYGACGIAETGAFGYDRSSDRALQYPVEVRSGNGAAETELWPDQIFAERPNRPGHWSFTWEPRHGSEDIVHEEVSFDPARLVFVDYRQIKQ